MNWFSIKEQSCTSVSRLKFIGFTVLWEYIFSFLASFNRLVFFSIASVFTLQNYLKKYAHDKQLQNISYFNVLIGSKRDKLKKKQQTVKVSICIFASTTINPYWLDYGWTCRQISVPSVPEKAPKNHINLGYWPTPFVHVDDVQVYFQKNFHWSK